MHDLKKNVEIASNYIKKCGIEVAPNINYKVSPLTSAWGYCHKKTTQNNSQSKISYTIEINRVLLDERVPKISLQQTIIHELLHTCENSMKHTGIWKHNAKKINQEGIYEITTSNTSESLKIPKEIMVEESKNYPYNYNNKIICHDFSQTDNFIMIGVQNCIYTYSGKLCL